MTSGQRAGVGLAGLALVLWSVLVIAVLATPPDKGANIGAGLIGLLALILSVLAAAVLITSVQSIAPRAASAASIILWAVFVALAWTYGAADGVLMSVGLAAIATLTASAVIVGTAPRRQRR